MLGTGGGYGESVILNLGNGDWVVVDSCKNPKTGECLPINFLNDRSVSLEQVKLIICTHWHDDHIGGISMLLEDCPNAVFCFARANDIKKFLQFVKLDYQKVNTSTSNSSTEEFNKCLDILSTTGRVAKDAICDRLLYSSNYADKTVEIYSLSPSDKSCQLFDDEISRLITEYGPPNKKLPFISPNDRSVVLLVKVDEQVIILGADLEVNIDENLGWEDILSNSQVVKSSNKSSYFKIPHHGSENGYHEGIWNILLLQKPVATLTPWNRNSKLPQEDMVNKYSSLTYKLFITSPIVVGSKPKSRDHKITKTIKQFNSSIRELKFQYGVVSSNLRVDEGEWSTALQGTASKIG